MRFLFSIGLVLIFGCAKSQWDPALIINGTQNGRMSAHEASQSTYRFAFSGQVLEEGSRNAIAKFTVELASLDEATSNVINPLGEPNGVFHVSRNPSGKQKNFASVSLIISAAGYEPSVHIIDLGSDCEATRCPGVKPTPFYLVKQAKIDKEEKGQITFLPARIQEFIQNRGITGLFKEAVERRKLDTSAENTLSKARNGQMFSRVLILFNDKAGSQAPHIIAELLGGAKEEKVKNLAGGVTNTVSSLAPLLASANPEIVSGLLASSPILSYLNPMADRISIPKGGPLGQVVAAFLRDGQVSDHVYTLVAAVNGRSVSHDRTQLAAASLAPLLEKQNATVPVSWPQQIFSEALADAALLNALSAKALSARTEKRAQLVATYLSPLIQGLNLPGARDLGQRFNQFVAERGIVGLQNSGKLGEGGEKFFPILPYLEPISRGLNSTDAQALAQLLFPLLRSSDPASGVQKLIEIQEANPFNDGTAIAHRVYPALGEMLRYSLSGKQVFAAQLLQGIINGDFKDLRVTQDLAATPALIVSGSARDIFKLTQLANVERVVVLPEK